MSNVSRCVMQQCVHARLMVKPEEEENPAQYVEIDKGVVIFVCFLNDATIDFVPKLVNSVLNVKLSPSEETSRRVSILDLPGNVLVVPQATLGGKMKGRGIQYHNNIPKDLGNELYTEFVKQMQEVFEMKKNTSNECQLHFGTYGNLQVLSMETNGPYTHIIEL